MRVLLGTPPWPDMLSRINFWSIRTASRQTAGDFAEFGIVRDTVLDTRYGDKSTGFIININNPKVAEVVQALIPEYDHILSISNSPLAVGRANANFNGNLRLRGGDFDNLSTVVTHELGHAVGLLADEYSDRTIIDTNYIYKGPEPTQANITTIPFAALTKWALELDGQVPYPTPQDLPGVGLFEGGNTYHRGVYHPEYNCMMRLNTPRFCVVCNREMRAQIIERSTAASLNYPLLLSSGSPGFPPNIRTSFAVVNTDTSKTADVSFIAYNENGKLLTGRGVVNPSVQLLEPARQTALLDVQLFGLAAPRNGWVRASATAPVRGFYMLSDLQFSEKIDGATANPEPGTDLALPLVRRDPGARFLFSVANPSTRSTTLSLSYYSSEGREVASTTMRTLLSKCQVLQGPPDGTAWVRIRSTSIPPVELEAAGMDYDEKTLSIQSAQILNVPIDALTLPHYAVGAGYQTNLVAVSDQSTTLVLTARKPDGQPAGSVQRVLEAGQLLDEPVGRLFNLPSSEAVQIGYITINSPSSQPGALQGVAALTYFRFLDESSAVCTAATVPRMSLMFSHVANETPAGGGKTFLTGLTLVNPNDVEAGFTVTVFNQRGSRVAERAMALAPHGKISRMLSGDPAGGAFFASPLSAGSGYIVVNSNQPLFGLELFFSRDLSMMAAVPAQ
jgi:hypothetical protein